jgi:formate hydrogenlyase subunit 3/multisubunit Na+/H+ antiporter MnhD subunit
VHLIGLTIVLILAYLAYRLPVGIPVPIRIWSGIPAFVLGESMPLLTARLVIPDTARPLYLIIYLSTAAWFAAAFAVRISSQFVPFTLSIAGLLSAALAITPSHFAPFLVEVAVLLSLPLLSPPGRPVHRGVRRFLIFQTLGMGILMLANWSFLLTAAQAGQQANQIPSFILFALGFALLLPVFPWHTWIPMVLGESNSLVSTCIIFLLTLTNSTLLFGSLARMGITGSLDQAIVLIRSVGVLMVFLGGASSAIESNPGRAIGFAMIQQIGMIMLALSLTLVPALVAPYRGLFFALFVPFGVSLLLCALSLEIFRKDSSGMELISIFSDSNRLPVASAGFLLGIFSLSGLSSLAAFPIYLSVLTHLEMRTPHELVFCVLGYLLLAVFGVRVLMLVNRSFHANPWSLGETRGQVAALSTGAIMLLLLGMFYNFYWPFFIEMSAGLNGSLP